MMCTVCPTSNPAMEVITMNGKQQYQTHIGKFCSSGFSLMELLIVLVIIGLLAAAVGPTLYKRVKQAKQTTAQDQIQSFMTALDNYFIDLGEYPSSQQGLTALRENVSGSNRWDGPYLTKEIPQDPWNKAYVYRSPGRSGGYEIFSYGADGVEGGEGENQDITSW